MDNSTAFGDTKAFISTFHFPGGFPVLSQFFFTITVSFGRFFIWVSK